MDNLFCKAQAWFCHKTSWYIYMYIYATLSCLIAACMFMSHGFQYIPLPFTTWSCHYKLMPHAYFFTISYEWGEVWLSYTTAELKLTLFFVGIYALHTQMYSTPTILNIIHFDGMSLPADIDTHMHTHTYMTRCTVLHINYTVGNQYGDKH